MENAKYNIRPYGVGFAVAVVFILLVSTCSYTFRSCSQNVQKIATELPQQTVQSINTENQIQQLQRDVEALQKQDSLLQTKIQKIDSLRLANARNTVNKSVSEHYRDLSDRYTNKKAIR